MPASKQPSLLRLLPPLLGVAALLSATAYFVDLTPQVGADFFFATGDPALEEEQQIADRFGALSQVVILASSPDVSSPGHQQGIERLTSAVRKAKGVLAVHSLARGPDDLEDARESPLWRRLLLAGDGRTSFLIAEIEATQARQVVARLEEIVARQTGPGLQLSMAGVPYTVEVMRRQLVRDFTVFSAAAVGVFALVVLAIFRSGWIVVGTLVTCGGAVAATLLALQLLGFAIGLLTANLTTIVFVLAQSHVVFMGSNWQALARAEIGAVERVRRARRCTLRASLASAATTLLGFASLLFVPARPLQELGAGGTLGAAIAFAAAYLVMPAFLERARPRSVSRGGAEFTTPRPVLAAGVALFAGLLALGLPWLDTDPSLLAYFDEDGEVHAALTTLDGSGGSSPLTMVVQTEDRARLDAKEPFERLWQLQHALEDDPAVGRVVSLPLLVAEAQRIPLVSWLKHDWILDLIGSDTTGAFLTRERRQTLYLLQMAESQRDLGRGEVISRLQDVASGHGFDVVLTGGIFALQARLADLVATSLLWSLAALVLLFAGVAALAAGSLRIGAAAGVATALVPLATLGGFGVFGIPLDVIAAPAASVGLGLAADAALHLIAAWRRRWEENADAPWGDACREQWRGVARSTGVVVIGFGLFALSSFPPTRRFGLGVALATAIGAVVALWLLPVLAQKLGSGGPAPANGES